MKKTIIAILLILSLTMVSVFALDGFTFYTGLGYDIRNVKTLNHKANSMDLEFGAKYPIGDGFNFYADLGIRFVGSGEVEGEKIKDGFLGTNLHVGILYGMRFIKAPQLEAYIGGGLSYSKTTYKASAHNAYFNNLGVGLKMAFAYRISDSFALAISEHADVSVLNSGTFCVGWAETVTAGALYKF